MTEDQLINLDLDVINVMKDFKPDQQNAYIYLRGKELTTEEFEVNIHMNGGYDLLVEMFIFCLNEEGNDIGRAMLDAVDIVNDKGI